MATRIIGLSGPSGSGKSEAARYLADAHGFTPVKFAGPLKAMLRECLRASGLTDEVEIDRRIEGDLKEEPCAYLNGRTPRHAMETLGTEWGRVCMGENFWVNAWARKVDSIKGSVVTDDCRFDNEAVEIYGHGPTLGVVIKVETNVPRRNKSNHKAERGVCAHLVDHTITNDGTVEDLKDKIRDILMPPEVETFGDWS